MLARIQIDALLQAKLDASDVVQQSLLEAHQSMADFRGNNDREKAAWLRRILARNLADELRKVRCGKRNVHLEASLEAALQESAARLDNWLAADEKGPSEYAMANEQLVALAAALAELPDGQRTAIELRDLHGCALGVIAARIGRTEIAVAGLLRRGLKRLRELLNDEGDS